LNQLPGLPTFNHLDITIQLTTSGKAATPLQRLCAASMPPLCPLFKKVGQRHCRPVLNDFKWFGTKAREYHFAFIETVLETRAEEAIQLNYPGRCPGEDMD